MPRFAANLTMLFTEVPFLERFGRAAAAGFEAVEFQFPYAFAAGAIRTQLDRHGLQLVLHNLPAGDWDAGDRGMACDPQRVGAFRAGLDQGIAYAKALGVQQLNCLAGKRPAGTSEAAMRQTLVDNLRFAAAALKQAGLRLLIEPINTYDIPGFYLNRTEQAIALIDEVGADTLFLQYDIYHAQRTEGEICGTLSKHLERIGHIQIAANPGRHEPGSGELNDAYVFAHLDQLGYSGWVGCEYRPATSTEAGLGWLQTVAQRPGQTDSSHCQPNTSTR